MAGTTAAGQTLPQLIKASSTAAFYKILSKYLTDVGFGGKTVVLDIPRSPVGPL